MYYKLSVRLVAFFRKRTANFILLWSCQFSRHFTPSLTNATCIIPTRPLLSAGEQ